MGLWADIELWRQRREELVREVQERALAREAGRARAAFAAAGERPVGVGVRWGLAEDEAAVAELLDLNGMPRWVAFEERFVVAEKAGRIVGAVRYRTESKRLLLGLLVVDPWVGERRTAKALYAGSRGLAEELGANEVIVSAARADYPRAAGYRRRGRAWRSAVSREDEGSSAGFWRRVFRLWGARAVPFHRAFRG